MAAALRGKVALVTGASRGIGRGIAVELGAAGATVYITGRSTSGGPATDNLPGTIDETAQQITEAGGQGIALRCDHTIDADVEAAFAQIGSRLDVLVNNVWGGYEAYDGRTVDAPFWEQPLARRWQGMFEAGVRAHLKASQLAAPLMIAQKRGLIVNISAGDTTGNKYLGWLPYDVAKSAVDRMAVGMAFELRPHNVAAISLYPGFTKTERVLEATGGEGGLETPHYTGRAVVALATDPNVMAKSGQAFMVGTLAREYGFTDTDGTQPEPFVLPAELLIDDHG